MFYFVLFSIATLALIILWIRNVSLYKKYYCGGMDGYFNLQTAQMYATFNGTILTVSHNFFNYNVNMAFHLAICGVLLFIISITEFVLIPAAYLLIVILKWKVHSARKASYQESISIYNSNALYGVFTSSVSVPTFCTIVFALLEVAYIFAP